MEAIREFLSMPQVLLIWAVLDLACVAVVIHDLIRHNAQTMPIMRLVWGLTVLYSGPLGLAIYYWSGRRQIARDSIWRKGFRSVSHCYSGCGLGEIVGLFICVGMLSLGNVVVSIVTFVLAWIAGFALTMKPLMDDGEPFARALRDAAWSETASIAVMEIAAIGVDLALTGNAQLGFGNPLFWSTMIVSLSCGLIVAYPVNLLLIHYGIKEGMHDPRQMAQHHGHGQHDDAHARQHGHAHHGRA